jgi:hypothetical protein
MCQTLSKTIKNNGDLGHKRCNVLLRYRLHLEELGYIILVPAFKLYVTETSKGPYFLSIAYYGKTTSTLSRIQLTLKILSRVFKCM